MDIRVERTYKLLVDAFEELLNEKPYQEISISEICERSTVRRATFYRHFEDKQDFFRYYLTTFTDKFMEKISAGYELDDLWEYARYMNIMFAEYAANAGAVQRYLLGHDITIDIHDMIVTQVADGIIERIKTYCEDNNVRLNSTPEFIGTFYSAGLVHMLRAWLFDDKPYSAEELERMTTGILKKYLD